MLTTMCFRHVFPIDDEPCQTSSKESIQEREKKKKQWARGRQANSPKEVGQKEARNH
jgi:hypothetical protein